LRHGYQPYLNARPEALNARLEQSELAWFDRTYQALAPGDFTTARAVRANVPAKESWVKQIRSWEEAWAGRTVADAVAKSRPLMASDPTRASALLRQVAKDLKTLDKHDAAQEELLAARRQAFHACLQGAQREASDLVRQDRFQAAAALAARLKKDLSPEALEV